MLKERGWPHRRGLTTEGAEGERERGFTAEGAGGAEGGLLGVKGKGEGLTAEGSPQGARGAQRGGGMDSRVRGNDGVVVAGS